MNRYIKILVLVITLVMAGYSSLTAEPRFYLSTDKIFTPGEQATITMETRGVPYIDIRVYKIDDPGGFFADQTDSHQPREINEYNGVNAIKIITSIFDSDMTLLRELPRGFLFSKFRAGLIEKMQELKEALIPSEKIRIHSEVKVLGKYPLLHHFRRNFSEGGSDWSYEKIPIHETAAGVYLVEGITETNVGYTMVVISRLGVITKQSGDTLLSYVVDKMTGQPMENIPVKILNALTRKEIGSGKTDKKGLLVSPIKNISQITLIAGNNTQFAIIDPTFFPVTLDHRKVYMYTDRPVYRPGQDVFYKGIARDFTNEIYSPVPVRKVNVTLYDPKGTEMGNETVDLNTQGTFNGHLTLSEEAALGTYKLIAEIEGKSYLAEFKIQEYKKPRYQVTVKLEGSAINGSRMKAGINGWYYFGAPVQEGELKYYVFRTRFYIPWWMDDDYSWYYSDAEYRNTRQEQIAEGEGKLDKYGNFSFTFDTKPDSDDYTYIVEARVKDRGGYTVTGRNTVRTSTGQFNISLRSNRLVYPKNQEITVTFRTRDLNNTPVAAGIDFKAVHMASQNVGKNGKNSGEPLETVIYSKNIQCDKNGVGIAKFSASKSGHIVLVARAMDTLNHVIQTKTSIWIASAGEAVGYTGEGIEIVSDKSNYRSNETARFLILSRIPNIPFLFTVEGGNLYSYKVEKFTGNSCIIDVPLKTLYTPNIFVQAAAVYEDRFYQKQKTIIIPPAEKFLKVMVTPEKKLYKPGDTVSAKIKVLDYKNNPVQAEVSLGVVDEAIYAISPELVVDMQKFFYPRKRNNVRTGNSLVFNFYGYSQDLKEELAALEMRPSSGLSSFKSIFERKLREQFKDTCYWIPAVNTAPDGSASVSFVLPDNITQWRFTARVVDKETRIGSVIEKVVSRKDLVLQLDPPQTFTEGDEILLPVLLRNTTAQPVKGSFQMDIQGGKITSTVPNSFSLNAYGSTTLYAKVKIYNKLRVVIAAEAKSATVSDGIKLTVPVTPYGVEKVQPLTYTFEPSETQKIFKFNLTEDGYNRFIKAPIYFHSGIYRALLSSLNYLAEYPYGCVEQTMSGFLPDVVLAGILDKLKISNVELKNKVSGFINSGINRLIGFQHEGNWGWWNEAQGDQYMTVYVMYGLTLARNLGYKVDSQVYNAGIGVIEKMMGNPGIPISSKVFGLYTLALADRAPVSIIMDVYKTRNTLSNYSLALLTLAASRAGKKTEAGTLADMLISRGTFDKALRTGYWSDQVKYRLLTEKESIATTAYALQAIITVRPQEPRVFMGVNWLMNQRNGERWNSTRDTAAVAIALAEIIARKGIKERNSDSVRFRLNNKTWHTVTSDKIYADNGESDTYLPYSELNKGENTLEIEKKSDSEMYMTMGINYFTTESDVETRTGPLTVQRKYYRMTATPDFLYQHTPIESSDNITFVPGEEFLVQINISAKQGYDYMMLEDFIPAGFQVIERNDGYNFTDQWITDTLLENRAITYKEIRDNRMVFFFSELNANKTVTVFYIMRAALEGSYEVNPAAIRSMYYENRYALSKRFHVNVGNENK